MTTETRTPELVIFESLTTIAVEIRDNPETPQSRGRQVDLIMRDLKASGFEIIDTLGDVDTEVAEILAETRENE